MNQKSFCYMRLENMKESEAILQAFLKFQKFILKSVQSISKDLQPWRLFVN